MNQGGFSQGNGKDAVPLVANPNTASRNRRGKTWHIIFQAATVVAIIVLSALLFNIMDSVFGYVAYEYKLDPADFAVEGILPEDQSREQLITLLKIELSSGAINKLENEKPLAERSQAEVYALVSERILKSKVVASWSLTTSLLNRSAVEEEVRQLLVDHPRLELKFVSWLTSNFITRPQSSEAVTAGVRTAILGSLLTILVTILFAFPLGVGAAIYLEEYATDNWLNRIIQTNINNLAGVPSIIYGILGLAIFVRALESLTSGLFLGAADASTATGRTILSAGLTLALLILPVIIINSQEAIRAVPQSLRKAGYGLGATKWQTIWAHVLPNAVPGILTGTILAISRAIGETAPLIVVGASTAISFDPGIFSRFTTLPIQIYQWTSRPQDEWRHLASAAILVLLIMLISLNASAIVLRNRFARKY